MKHECTVPDVLLNAAIHWAVRSHTGQQDKAGFPYILHPLRVMLSMKTDEERIVAVLHDVVEDSSTTFKQLREGFKAAGAKPEVVQALADAIDSVTRRKDEYYMTYIRRAKQNAIGRQVKIADIKDNTLPERIACLPEQERGIVERYEKALKVLQEE